jgi:hypothetical protein
MPPNLDDDVIDEIRAIRRRISEQFQNDPGRLVAYYMQLQEQYRDRLWSGAKEPPESAPDADPVTAAASRG